MNTTVCDGNSVNITCGITNDNLGFIPSWIIIKRDSNGNIISKMDILTIIFFRDEYDDYGLVWIYDLNNSENNRLLISPVNETYNQSSFQCYIPTLPPIKSSVGILTVAGEIFYYVCIVYVFIV